MNSIKIITDSAADIPPNLVQDLAIDVIPLTVRINDQNYRSGIDISNDEFFALIQDGNHSIKVIPPSATTFEQRYRALAAEYDYVFSLHMSNRLGGTYRSAVQACKKLPASLTRLEPIDTKSLSMGLGMVVIGAAEAAMQGASPHEVRQVITSMMQHTHVVFFVDTMDYLEQTGQLSLASSVVGSMQRIKPLMIIDDGEIVPYERTRTRAKAIEGLYTFIEDFPHVQEVTVLYATTPEDVEKLLEKVEPIFPRDRVQIAQFAPSIAAYLGPGAMGVTVFEGIGNVEMI